MGGSVLCFSITEPVERRRGLLLVGAAASTSFVCIGEAILELEGAIGVSCVVILSLR